ncbi:MAG: bifunctional diaminohydroxyphosphoribosylaminopyrimidine deaminase/5-amino-6-(5-phosphoribosylamino)uracil reductase RibD [Parafilimonas sp.]
MLTQHELYMHRCIQLAKLAAGNVAPNPMVGAVLVYENRIIGEGYHKKYGEAHAEVNCINSVNDADKHLIGNSTLYVSLEPCAHFGKTPPCSNLIISQKIPKIFVGSIDPFKEVDGKGIQRLKSAGVEVISGILEKECKELNKRFFNFHLHHKPYIILKWAQTADNKISDNPNKRLIISNEFTNRLVHKWRSEETGILVGTNTIIADDALLTNRLWSGKNRVRFVIDKDLKLAKTYKVFNNDAPTIIFNLLKNNIEKETILENQVYYYKIDKDRKLTDEICDACYNLNIQSILVEGGAKLLQSFIDDKIYNEIIMITNTEMKIGNGLQAPELNGLQKIVCSQMIRKDKIEFFL